VEYFQHEAEEVITIYPLVCMHIGAAQADEEFIAQHVQRIADDPTGRWVYLGDGGECVTKVSKGELYDQKLSPDEQISRVEELLEPIRGKGLFGISGNHDRRISKLSGLDWTKALCSRLSLPYLGISAFMRLTLKPRKNGSTKLPWHLFWHHGVDSSSIIGGKIRAAKKLEDLVIADAIFSAHSHICLDSTPLYRAYLPTGKAAGGIKYRETRSFICGCAYDSRVPGYAEEKGYSPILPAYLSVTFSGERKQKHQGPKSSHYDHVVPHMDCTIYRKALV
jgi:hypothetical protein